MAVFFLVLISIGAFAQDNSKATVPYRSFIAEVGAGATYVGKYSDFFNDERDPRKSRIIGTTSFMYRRIPTNGGFSWRVGFTPVISNSLIQFSGAASVGFNF